MKKISILTVSVVVISLVAYFFSSCSDKDTIAPLIFLKGGDTIVELEMPYIEPPAVAEDNSDGQISSQLVVGWDSKFKKKLGSDSVTSKAQIWDINYYIKDKAGNEKTLVRKVDVRNWAWSYETNYLMKRRNYLDTNATTNIGYQYGYRGTSTRPLFKATRAVTTDKAQNLKVTFNTVGGDLKLKLNGKIWKSGIITFRDTTVKDASNNEYRITGKPTDTCKVLNFYGKKSFRLIYSIERPPYNTSQPIKYIETYYQ